MSPLAQLLISQMPTLVSTIKVAWLNRHPNGPAPTSEEVIRAFDQLFADDIAKDEMLRIALKAEIDGQ